MKITWVETYEFTEKHIHLLLEIEKAGGEISYGFDEYNWMHSAVIKPIRERKHYMEKDEEKSYDKEWRDLCDWGFLEKSDDGSEYSYFKKKLTFKAKDIIPRIKLSKSFYEK